MKKALVILVLIGLICITEGCKNNGDVYKVVERSRDISFGSEDTSRFMISPAKISIHLKVGQVVKIPMTITNEGDRMTFSIGEEQPPTLDKGYQSAGSEYSYGISTNTITVDKLSSKTVIFSIKKESDTDVNQEKGFIIKQVPETSQTVSVARGYIFEVLLEGRKK